ncbi:MAG TPA: hypothetical protein VKS78_14790 [Roseiarcus sp.]|nr:hypothetical protein [Roseiarcus sp.]
MDVPDVGSHDEQHFFANLMYLQDHGLCEPLVSQGLDGHFAWGGAKITARGLDFLEDDGGLSAVLGIVTVKLHADTVRELLAAKIDVSPLSPSEKSTLKKALRGLSDTALRSATTDLIHSGLQHIPNIAEWLRTFVGL